MGKAEPSPRLQLQLEVVFLVCFSFLLAPSWFHNIRKIIKDMEILDAENPIQKMDAHLQLMPSAFTLVPVRENPPS